MIGFTRPPEPDSFATNRKGSAKNKVEKARERVELDVENGRLPTFPDHWRSDRVKRLLAKAQCSKCGYCEIKVLAGSTGDIEHFAPKGQIHDIKYEMNPQGESIPCWGKEKEGLSNIKGRETVVICKTGYWFHAYDWTNYLLACERCNTAYKRCLFPVVENPRPLPPTKDNPDTPMLLNPFDEDPIPHLHFDEIGQITAKTDKGKATIDVCGLDRETLRDARQEKAERAYLILAEYLMSEDPSDLKAILKSGSIEYEHAGMVRSIIYHEMGFTWEQFTILAEPRDVAPEEPG